MAALNQFALSQALGSRIVGKVEVLHGQIGAAKLLADVNSRREALDFSASAPGSPTAEDRRVAAEAFLAARDDRFSIDAWIADPERNARFLVECRLRGTTTEAYVLNKALMYERKTGALSGLQSERLKLAVEDLRFAAEFTATRLRYLCGATPDDILCHPELAAEFDRRVGAMAPARRPLEYRWALLRARKASGRKMETAEEPALELADRIPLAHDFSSMPQDAGVLMLQEDATPLFVQSSRHLRAAAETFQQPRILNALASTLWEPAEDRLFLAFAPLDAKFRAVAERRLVRKWRPLFNLRAA